MTNVKNTTKAYALFAIVPLLLVGFGGNAFAVPQSNSYSASEVEYALEALTPYVTINDKKIAKIDVSEAKANGVSNEYLKIVQEYLKLQNKMIQDVHDDPTKKMKVSKEGKEKFTKFHEKVRKEGFKDKTVQTSFLDSLLPLAYATHLCNVDGPHSQPDVKYTGSYATVQAAINALPSSYHKVEEYASAFEHDYADWVSAYFCADGVFRYQVSIVDQGNNGDYQHRESLAPGEPNPEVLDYWWPVYWWGFYVYEWHNP